MRRETPSNRAEQLSRLMLMLPKCSTSTLAGMADALENDLVQMAGKTVRARGGVIKEDGFNFITVTSFDVLTE